MKATFRAKASTIDHTPVSALSAGDFVEIAGRMYITCRDIAAGALGALYSCGIFRGAKVTGAVAIGDYLYWNPTGDPVGGTAGTGALTTNAALGTFAGTCTAAALSGDATVDFLLHDSASLTQLPSSTVAATGSVQGDAAQLALGLTLATAGDGTKGVKLPAAAPGKVAIVKNGAAAILKVYPATADAINALSANAAISMAANTSAVFVAYDSTTWYTVPLLPS